MDLTVAFTPQRESRVTVLRSRRHPTQLGHVWLQVTPVPAVPRATASPPSSMTTMSRRPKTQQAKVVLLLVQSLRQLTTGLAESPCWPVTKRTRAKTVPRAP